MIQPKKISDHPNYSKYFDGFAATLKPKERLKILSQLPCLCCLEKGRYLQSNTHHLRTDLDGRNIGMSERNSDLLTIPLCKWHHQLSNKESDPSVHGAPKAFALKWSGVDNIAEAELNLLALTNFIVNQFCKQNPF